MLSEESILRPIGGPTLLLNLAGLTILTDPTFDPAGTEYHTPVYVLRKTSSPLMNPGDIRTIDVVLLSHDHHFDNLDHSGRALLPLAGKVVTTHAGAVRLGGNAVGLNPWERIVIPTRDGRQLQIMGTPARHGPEGGDRGPVTGFVLDIAGDPGGAIYLSGDTVWYEEIREIGERAAVGLAVLFMGAATVPEVGPHHLTMTAKEALQFAACFPSARIVPIHCEGWAHFTESRMEIHRTFMEAGLDDRLLWLPQE